MSFIYETRCDRCGKRADDWNRVPETWVGIDFYGLPPREKQHLCAEWANELGIPPDGFSVGKLGLNRG